MNRCSKCNRFHGGICGIPAGVTFGFGARLGGVRQTKAAAFPLKGKMKSMKKGTGVLKKLLEEARIREKNVTHMLTIVPSQLPEFDLLLDRLGKLEALTLQLTQQIITRETM